MTDDWDTESCEDEYTPNDDPTEWEQEAWDYLEWREENGEELPF